MSALEQPMRALASANAKRSAAAEVKRQIHAGKMSVAEALSCGRAESAKVVDLLTAQRSWGVVRAEKALLRAGWILWGVDGPPLTPSRHAGELSDRARDALVEALGGTS